MEGTLSIVTKTLMNNITKNYYSDEWYTDQNTVDVCLQLLSATSESTVMCPFDSHKSLFVKTLLNRGHKVIFGIEDYLDSEYEYDFLVTNPPFSIKDKVIERVLGSGKRSVLVLPLDSIGGVKRHSLYRKYGYPQVYVPTRRISYFDESWHKREGSNFHSVFMLFNHNEESKIIWEGQ